MHRAFLVFCLLLATACVPNRAAAPTAPFDLEFVIAQGDTRQIEGHPLSLQFSHVSGDSRCPADAVCVLGGDATVHLRVSRDGIVTNIELHTGDANQASATLGEYRITLTELQPYPFSSRPIDPAEYRATLRVGRALVSRYHTGDGGSWRVGETRSASPWDVVVGIRP